MDFQDSALMVVSEVRDVISGFDDDQVPEFVDDLVQSRTIACCGVGREGLMVEAFAMRLMHLGLDAHVVGDMTTPSIGEGDLLVASAGPGYLSTIEALMDQALQAGARVNVVTAEPEKSLPQKADRVLIIPARTMAKETESTSIQPMGCTFEQAQLVVFDTLVLELMEQLDETEDSMARRHTNLE